MLDGPEHWRKVNSVLAHFRIRSIDSLTSTFYWLAVCLAEIILVLSFKPV